MTLDAVVPDDPASLTARAGELLDAGQIGQAIETLGQALTLAPTDPAIHAKLAASLVRAGRPGDALTVLEQGLAFAPDNAELLIACAWLFHNRGELGKASDIVHQLTKDQPDFAGAWHLLGVLYERDGALDKAEECLARAYSLAPNDADIVIRRSSLIRRRGRHDDAAWLLEVLLDQHPPDDRLARVLLAQLRLDQNKPDQARTLLHEILRDGYRVGEIWWLLAATLHRLGRLMTARYAVQRACRLAPDFLPPQQLTVWLDLEAGDIAAARATSRHLIQMAPTHPDILSQAAFAALAAGDIADAINLAERAVFQTPDAAESWRCLGEARYRQKRLDLAEQALQTGLKFAPDSAEILRSLARVLIADDRLAEAEIALRRALEINPGLTAAHLEFAEINRLAGRFSTALATIAIVLEQKPALRDAIRLRARCRIDEPSRHIANWNDAVDDLAYLLRDNPTDRDSARLLLRLSARGSERARQAVPIIPRRLRQDLLRELVEWAVAYAGATELGQIARFAVDQFPEDDFIASAQLYADAMGGTSSDTELNRQIRIWGRRFALTVGSAPVKAPGLTAGLRQGRRLRVAYLASYLHSSLLLAVIAAHDRERIEPILYTTQVAEAEALLRGAALVQPLDGSTLAKTLIANEIDIVVDTVGLHPCHGQFEVLKLLAQHAVPVQCAWLGAWGAGGGLYDAIIGDAASLAPGAEADLDEAVIRLPGGQWAWTPPIHAPDPGPLPYLSRGHIVFGSTVRGFRMSGETIAAWAKILAALPGSRLELLGRQSRDWPVRAEIAEIMQAHSVDPDRVGYQFQRDYAGHLDFFRGIDIALDTFPGNGGLCSLDALWMGVPLISCSGGRSRPAANQGRSILEAIGHAELAAASIVDYVNSAVALAGAPDRLARYRATLRNDMLASPLVDAKRVASALEDGWRQMIEAAQPIATAPDAKARARMLAKRELSLWLDRKRRLALPRAEKPDISIVIILFNQAGLTRQALAALADQQDARFETIIIDNGSSDETDQLLDRIDGATIVRNQDNRGFLLAANQGAALATGRHILFLNNDAVVLEGSLAAAVRRLDSDASIGAVGGRIVLGDATLQEAGSIIFKDGSTLGYGRGEDPNDPAFRFVRDVDFCSGAFYLIRSELWRSLGGFDTAFAPAYYEDTDLGARINEAGFRFVYDPNVVIGHLEWGSATTNNQAIEQMKLNRTIFRTKHAALCVARSDARARRPVADRWAARPGLRILFIDNEVPHMSGGGGLPRARLMLRALEGHHVTFFPLWRSDDDWRSVYASLPETTEVMLGIGAAGLERFLEDRRGVYQVIVISRPPNMKFVNALKTRRPDLFRDLRIVYDAEALFALRDIGRAGVLGKPLGDAEQHYLIHTETALALDADRVLSVSHADAVYFGNGGVRDIRIVSHGMTTRADAPGVSGRSGLLFIGALAPDTPNEDGLLWLAKEVLPYLPTPIPLTIVGDCRSSRIAGLQSETIRVVGPIDDLTPFYDSARMFVAPARYAGGIAAKIIEAACNGLPVVASALLGRQLGWLGGSELLAARNAPEFATEIARLNADDDLWTRLQATMQARTRAQFDPAAFDAAVRAAVDFS